MTEDNDFMMDVEYGIDSRYNSGLESVSEATAFNGSSFKEDENAFQ